MFKVNQKKWSENGSLYASASTGLILRALYGVTTGSVLPVDLNFILGKY